MSAIADFLVRIGYDLDKSSQGRVEKSVKDIGRAVDTLAGKVSTLKGAFAAVAGAFAASKLSSHVTEVANRFDLIDKAASRVGASSAEEFAKLQYAFEQNGVAADTLTGSLENFSEKLGEARLEGKGEGFEVFQKLGIDISSVTGKTKDTIAVFRELQERFEKLPQTTRVAYAGMLSLDPKLINTMMLQKEQLNALEDEYISTYAAAGIGVGDAIKGAADYSTALGKLQHVFTVVTDVIAVHFFGTATAAMESLRQWIIRHMSAIAAVLRKGADLIGAVAKAFIAMGKTAGEIIGRVIEWWRGLSPGMKTTIGLIAAMTAAFLILNSAFMKSPIGRLLAIATLIGLLIDDFRVWKEGGDSLIGEWLGSYDEFMKSLEDSSGTFGWLKSIIAAVLPYTDYLLLALGAIPIALKIIMPVIGALKAALLPLIGTVIKLGAALLLTPVGWIVMGIAAVTAAGVLLYKNWEKVREVCNSVWNAVKEKIGGFLNWVKETYQSIADFISNLPENIAKAWNAIPDLIAAIPDLIKKGWEGLKNFITSIPDLVQQGWEKLKNFVVSMPDSIKAAWDSVVSWISSKVEAVTGTVRKAINGFKRLIGMDVEEEPEDAPAAAAAPEPEAPAALPPPPSAAAQANATQLAMARLRYGTAEVQQQAYDVPLPAAVEKPRAPAILHPLAQSPQVFASMNRFMQENAPAVQQLGGALGAAAAASGTMERNMSVLPPPPAAAQGGRAPVQIEQANTTNITVQGAASPEATARAVAAQQQSVFSDNSRNLARGMA